MTTTADTAVTATQRDQERVDLLAALHGVDGSLRAVDHERVVAELVVEALQREVSHLRVRGQQRPQRALAVGHVAGVLEALVGLAGPDGVAAGARGQAQVREGDAGQGAPPAGS